MSKVYHSVLSSCKIGAVMNGALTFIVIDPDSESKVSQGDFEHHDSVVGAVLGNLDPEF